MTLDLDNMTQAEFDDLMAEIKENEPNLFQFIVDGSECFAYGS